MTKQANKKTVPAQGKKPLTAKQKENAAKKKALQKFIASEAKKRADEQRRAQDAQYKAILKQVGGKGIYDPKGTKLTRYRRRRAKTIAEQWGEFLNPTEYFFIPAPKKAKAKILERARSLEFPATKEGLFVRKGGHKRATIREDEKRGEFYIERAGRTKKGINKGRKYTSVIPLAGLDQLDAERDRIAHAAEMLMPLKGNEALVFVVMENGVEGRSQQSFGDVDLLMRKLDKYEKKTAARLNFYRHIEVQKVSSYIDYAKMQNERDAEQGVTPRGKRRTRKVKSGKFDTRSRK